MILCSVHLPRRAENFGVKSRYRDISPACMGGGGVSAKKSALRDVSPKLECNKPYVWGQANLLTKRGEISGTLVSFQDSSDPRQSLQWVQSFVAGGCLDIIGLVNANRNHFSGKIIYLVVQTMENPPNKLRIMGNMLFLLSVSASDSSDFSSINQKFENLA